MFKGFTLSETLITLGIIGAIGAITIPSLIQNHQKKQTAVKLKHTYSLMMQALKIAENDLGNTDSWEVTNSKTFCDTYIKPYYKVIKEYNLGELPSDTHIYCNNGGICDSYGNFTSAQKLILSNGVLIAPYPLSVQEYNTTTIIVDINGLKRPNRYGRDVFMFNIDAKKGIIPYGLGYIAGQSEDRIPSRNDLMNDGDWRACKKQGLFCAGVIMLDGWEISDDYPG